MDFIGFILAIFTWAILLKPIFGDFDHFKYCIRYKIIPDFYSLIKGEFREDL